MAISEAKDPDSIDIKDFTYPGPAPRSRETALVMLADGTEARARSHSPRTDEEIMAVVEDAINTTKNSGQLDNTDLTLKTYKLLRILSTTHSSSHTTLESSILKPNP